MRGEHQPHEQHVLVCGQSAQPDEIGLALLWISRTLRSLIVACLAYI
jgi:hypothetical protein